METNQKNSNKSGSRFANTVAGATGGKADGADDAGGGEMVMPKEAQAMIVKPTPEMIAALMSDDNLEFAPQFYTIEEGTWVVGVLEGRGPATTFDRVDPVTKQDLPSQHVDTWIIRHPLSGYRISILSSIQLDDKLPPFIGSEVTIYRGKEKRTAKGYKVTDYTVSGPKKTDGSRRSFIKALPPIDAQSRELGSGVQAPQLAAGRPDGEDAVA